jgi:hypothetical protein
MTKQEEKNLQKEAIKEIKNLKKHATKEQLDELDVRLLQADSARSCIYGQMTGSCYSIEANKLLVKCAKPLYSDITDSSPRSFINYALRNRSNPFKHDMPFWGGREYYSALEAFIYHDDRLITHEAIIDYLQDKTYTLNL